MAPLKSDTFVPPLPPLFTKELLTHIEEELANNNEFFEVKDADGKVHHVRNVLRGVPVPDVCRRPNKNKNKTEKRDGQNDDDDNEKAKVEDQGQAPQIERAQLRPQEGTKNQILIDFRGERHYLSIKRRREEEEERKRNLASTTRTGTSTEKGEEEAAASNPAPGQGQGLPTYFPVYPFATYISPASRSVQETRSLLRAAIADFEPSREAAALSRFIKTQLRGCVIDKVIMFGLGAIGFDRQSSKADEDINTLISFYEHAAARVIHAAVSEVSSAPKVQLLVQDPCYTDVCIAVLEDQDLPDEAKEKDEKKEEEKKTNDQKLGFKVIRGFGTKGFTLMDENSIVVAHHPSFPFREIVADLARPALICMRRRIKRRTIGQVPDNDKYYFRPAEVDTVRSDRMLDDDYREEGLQGLTRPKIFYDNVWYVRNDLPRKS